jgi:hypothetical protein
VTQYTRQNKNNASISTGLAIRFRRIADEGEFFTVWLITKPTHLSVSRFNKYHFTICVTRWVLGKPKSNGIWRFLLPI